ncbi:MAG TPA: hypothetical protein VIW23_16540 [Candidatus Acidoferrum sp.]|jgi:hypothetical protein
MRRSQFLACPVSLVFLLSLAIFASVSALAQESHSTKKITVYGRLTRVVAIGAETTGWSLEFRRRVILEGKKMRSIEVSGHAEEFEKLNDQEVKVSGILTHHTGVERPDHLVLEVSSISAMK